MMQQTDAKTKEHSNIFKEKENQMKGDQKENQMKNDEKEEKQFNKQGNNEEQLQVKNYMLTKIKSVSRSSLFCIYGFTGFIARVWPI